MKALLILSAVSFFALSTARAEEAVWDTRNKTWISLEELATSAQGGDIFVFGETHATPDSLSDPQSEGHHRNQVRFLEMLRAHTSPRRAVSVGMEFLTYPHQPLVDQFRGGELSEDDFLRAVEWGLSPFEFYRRQVLFPGGGRTVALNIPRAVSGQVSRGGPGSLDENQRKFLPPIWDRGGAEYFARFQDVMKDHASPIQIENYFWAQSLWDDTMAWKALESQQAHPDEILVIIVGSFHVEFGQGLPSELKRQQTFPVKTLLQVEVPDWQPETLDAAVRADAVYGEAADYLWVNLVP